MTHFLDESFRSQPALYVVAAANVETNLAEVGLALKALLPRRVPRFHWAKESEAMRVKMLETLVSLGVIGHVYVCTNEPKLERARTRCLERLLWDFMQQGAAELVFESRERRNDQRDRMTILQAQKKNAASPGLRYRFERPHEEPLLWLADALAGATRASLGGERDYLATTLEACVDVVEVSS